MSKKHEYCESCPMLNGGAGLDCLSCGYGKTVREEYNNKRYPLQKKIKESKMSKYRKRPVVINATQWFKNGDHPQDHDEIGYENPTERDLDRYYDYKNQEGKVVRYFRRPDISGLTECKKCGKFMKSHGWVDTLEGGHIVCPGDFIITGIAGEIYPCKPDVFEKTYELINIKG